MGSRPAACFIFFLTVVCVGVFVTACVEADRNIKAGIAQLKDWEDFWAEGELVKSCSNGTRIYRVKGQLYARNLVGLDRLDPGATATSVCQ